jgi:hypothetical protein
VEMETLKYRKGFHVPQLHDYYEDWMRSLVVAGFMIYINYEGHVYVNLFCTTSLVFLVVSLPSKNLLRRMSAR